MATGLTMQLEEMKYNVPRWLKETIIRQMGVCVTLRDERNNMTAEEIKRALEKESNVTYYRDRLTEAEKEYTLAKKRTKAEWQKLFEREQAEAKRDYDRRLKEHVEKKEAHQKALDQVSALLAKATRRGESEIVVNALKLAKEQLEDTMKWDYDRPPSKDSCLTTTLPKWIKVQVECAKNNIKYNKENLEEQEARSKNRVDAYLSFITFVDEATAQ